MNRILVAMLIIMLAFTYSVFAQTDSLNICWTPNPEPDISHYVVYRSINSVHSMTQIATITHPNACNVDKDNIAPGNTYSYCLVAIDTAGMQSNFSDTVSVSIPKITWSLNHIQSGQQSSVNLSDIVSDDDDWIYGLEMKVENATNISCSKSFGKFRMEPQPMNYNGPASFTLSFMDGDSLYDKVDVQLTIGTMTGIENPNAPSTFLVEQNYPNPFNPTTTIKYQLPQNEHVVIDIFNSLGQKVKTLFNNEMSAGYHQVVWDGTNDFNQKVSSGMYVYSIKAGENQSIRRMQLVK